MSRLGRTGEPLDDTPPPWATLRPARRRPSRPIQAGSGAGGAQVPARRCSTCSTPLSRPASVRRGLCAECRWYTENRRLLAAERQRVIDAKLRALDTEPTAAESRREGEHHE